MIKRCPADKFFSWFIRELADWKCSYCFKQFERKSKALHCSHFFSRRAESTRFLPNNCDSHCSECHKFFTEHPEGHRSWKIANLGQKAFDELVEIHNTMKKKNRSEEAKYWK